MELGGGEQVSLWIDKWRDIDLLKREDGTYHEVRDSMGDVVWESSGASCVFPIIGPSTVMTADIGEKDETGSVNATVFDSGTKGVDPPVVASLGPTCPKRSLPSRKMPEAETKADLFHALWAVDRLRSGRKTPFDEVERCIGNLLKQYPAPKDHGQIYYEAAHIYAQTGLVRPQVAINYAKKALQYPVESAQQIRLYGYWGSAVFMLKRTDPFPQRRLAAATIFLGGLVQLRQFKVPEKVTELPLAELHDRRRRNCRKNTSRNWNNASAD